MFEIDFFGHLTVCKQMTDVCLNELLLIHSNTQNNSTVCKRMRLGLFKNVINKMCLQIIYLIYTYKEDLVLNNLQWLICHKTKPNESSLLLKLHIDLLVNIGLILVLFVKNFGNTLSLGPSIEAAFCNSLFI